MSAFTNHQLRRVLGIPLTLSFAEFGALDIGAAGTAEASKAVVLGASKDIATITTLGVTTGNFTTLNTTTLNSKAATTFINDATDATKQITFLNSGMTTGKISTLAFVNTNNATYTFPAATSTLATLAGTETLSGKTLTDPIITNITRCSAQLDKTDTTLTNITGLSQTVAVGTYRFRYVLKTSAGSTGGFKTAFKYTTTVVSAIDIASYGYTASAVAVALSTTTTDQATHINSATANISIICEGTMTVSTGGTVALQAAENNAAGTSSILVGSYMEFTRIA